MNDDVIGTAEFEDVEMPQSRTAQLTQSDDIDWHLAKLVDIANGNFGVSIGVTLTVNGALVSGLLISGKEYFESVAIELAKDSDNSVSMGLSEGMKELSEKRYGSKFNPATHRTAFIHLKNARHFLGGVFVPENGTFWRGKLCDVSGFSLGLLKQN